MAAQRLVVVGGGISGLAAALKLAENPGNDIILLEGSRHVGGWITTAMTKDGALFEHGPRSLRTIGTQGRFTLALISSLGLEKEVVPVLPTNTAARRRFIYTHKHGIVELPSGLSWLVKAKPPFTRPLLSAVIKELWTPPANGDESVHKVISDRLGKEIADYIADPLCHGIFAGNSHELSFKACFPRFQEYLEKHRSFFRAMVKEKPEPVSADFPEIVRTAVHQRWQFYTLRNGMSVLPDALAHQLKKKGVKVLLEHPCNRILFNCGSKVQVVVDGHTFEADHVVSAVRSASLGHMLGQEHPMLATLLQSIPFVDVVVVNLLYKDQVLPTKIREGFGYLVPSCEPSKALGVVFDSSVFPMQNGSLPSATRLTMMLGGHLFTKIFGNCDAVDTAIITKAALETLKDHLGIAQDPIEIATTIQRKCIPQYVRGHLEKTAKIHQYIVQQRLPLTVVGASYFGAGVTDCIYNSYNAFTF